MLSPGNRIGENQTSAAISLPVAGLARLDYGSLSALPFAGAESIKCLSIDLDNTLWDVMPTLVAAEAELEQWLQANCPAALLHYQPEVTTAIREELLVRYPRRAHDLSFLRRSVLEQVLQRAGADRRLADRAFDVFFAARNRVTLFDDVVPALRRLADRYVLVALTDGNADLRLVGLDGHFDHCVYAVSVGAAKPAAVMFAAVQRFTQLQPREILHVGDDPSKDILGAHRYGMHSAWVNRTGAAWADPDIRPDAEVEDLDMLADGLLGST